MSEGSIGPTRSAHPARRRSSEAVASASTRRWFCRLDSAIARQAGGLLTWSSRGRERTLVAATAPMRKASGAAEALAGKSASTCPGFT